MRGPGPMVASPGPILPVLTEITLGDVPEILQRTDKGAGQPLMEVRWRNHFGQSVVVLGEVGTQGCDDHVGALGGLNNEVGVEDIGVDQDFDLPTGRDGRHGPVDGSDCMAAPAGKFDEVLADRPRSSKTVTFMMRTPLCMCS